MSRPNVYSVNAIASWLMATDHLDCEVAQVRARVEHHRQLQAWHGRKETFRQMRRLLRALRLRELDESARLLRSTVSLRTEPEHRSTWQLSTAVSRWAPIDVDAWLRWSDSNAHRMPGPDALGPLGVAIQAGLVGVERVAQAVERAWCHDIVARPCNQDRRRSGRRSFTRLLLALMTFCGRLLRQPQGRRPEQPLNPLNRTLKGRP